MESRSTRDHLLVTSIVIMTLAAPSRAEAITNGELASRCDWPSVVFLSGTDSVCSGVYVGGRVVLTAAHCATTSGYYLADERLAQRINPAWPDSDRCFDNDGHCPDVFIEGEQQPLTCEPIGANGDANGPGPAGSCFYPGAELTKNWVDRARFGESYLPDQQGHPTNAIPIEYCRIVEAVGDGMGGDPNDFAYCVLASDPGVAPVPLITECEITQYLDGSQPLPVEFVGFGRASGRGTPGHKRFATAAVESEISPDATLVSYTKFSALTPGNPSHGDSGGGVFVQLPDQTWRLIGIMVTGGPVGQYVSPWHHLDWMLEDPHVLDEGERLLPCHNTEGEWAPTSACGSFPTTPDVGAGYWARGPRACDSPNLGPPDPLPPPACPNAGSPVDPPDPEPPASGADRQVASPACSVGPSSSGRALGLLALLTVAHAWRRRRRGLLGVACSFLLLTACPGSNPGGTQGADATGTTGTGGDPAEPIALNPNIQRVYAGEVFMGRTYEQIAVGNILRPALSQECCLDYVVGGSGQATIEILPGGGDDTGMAFLAAQPNIEVSMSDVDAEGITDLLVTDLDLDGNNDIVAQTSAAKLTTRLGQPEAPNDVLGPLQVLAAEDAIDRNIVAGNLDEACDGAPDIAAASSAGVISTFVNEGGILASGSRLSVGPNLRGIAVGDFNGDARGDLVTVHGDGRSYYVLGECGVPYGPTFVFKPLSFVGVNPDCQPGGIETCVFESDNATVHAMPACGGERDDIVIAFADSIYAFCNDGTGSFDPLSFVSWDLNDAGTPQSDPNLVAEPFWWSGTGTLYAIKRRRDLIQLDMSPQDMSLFGSQHFTVLKFGGGTSVSEFALSPSSGGDSVWWTTAAWIGTKPGYSEIGFGR